MALVGSIDADLDDDTDEETPRPAPVLLLPLTRPGFRPRKKPCFRIVVSEAFVGGCLRPAVAAESSVSKSARYCFEGNVRSIHCFHETTADQIISVELGSSDGVVSTLVLDWFKDKSTIIQRQFASLLGDLDFFTCFLHL